MNTTVDNHCKTIVDALPVCVMLLRSDGVIQEMNASGLYMVEADSFERIRDKPFQHIVAPEFRSAFLELLRKVGGGSAESLEYQITGLLGSRRWLTTDAVPYRGPDGSADGILAVTRDITERVHREGKSRYEQKMEAISTLASGVAHDFNNILTAIVGYANVLKLKMPDSDPLRAIALQVLASADRGSGITKGLLSFGSRQILDLKPADLNETVRRSVSSFSKEAGEGISVWVKTTDAPLGIMADEGEIENCLRNMLSNARDAMPGGGTISLATGTMELEDTFISIHGYGTKGAYAVVSVTDTGVGMDERTRKKAFEPFFTTKDTGKGLGLGLAMVYGIVKSHRGFVNVYSEPGVGTTFRMYLPLSGVRLVDNRQSSLLPEGKGELVLLAEDDESIRKITQSLLEQFGYRVIAAQDGEDAVRLFRENREAVHLALIDINMPRLDGREAYAQMRGLRADIKVLFSSGYTEDFIRRKDLLPDNIPIVTKPVSPKDLLRKIREVLEP